MILIKYKRRSRMGESGRESVVVVVGRRSGRWFDDLAFLERSLGFLLARRSIVVESSYCPEVDRCPP